MPKIVLPTKEPPAYPPCETLRRARISAGISQPVLSVLCFLAQLTLESQQPNGIDPANDMNLSREASPDTLMLAVIFLRRANCVDSTHLSKFERGHQRPWKRARECLCFVFSQILQRPVSEEELFPEIDLTGPNDPLLNFSEALLAAREHQLDQALA